MTLESINIPSTIHHFQVRKLSIIQKTEKNVIDLSETTVHSETIYLVCSVQTFKSKIPMSLKLAILNLYVKLRN